MTTTDAFKPLSKDEVAAVLDVHPRTIENWVNARILPAPKRIGNRIYWHPEVFYAWLEHHLTSEETVTTNSEPPMGKPQKAERKSQAKSSKSEVDILRLRDQAKIDALLA